MPLSVEDDNDAADENAVYTMCEVMCVGVCVCVLRRLK